jgi:hypothetical protein
MRRDDELVLLFRDGSDRHSIKGPAAREVLTALIAASVKVDYSLL